MSNNNEKSSYLAVIASFNDSADQRLNIWQLLESLGEHQEHIGGILEVATCVGIETFKMVDSIGFGSRANDLPERLESMSKLQEHCNLCVAAHQEGCRQHPVCNHGSQQD